MNKQFMMLLQSSEEQFQQITQLNESQQLENTFTESIENNTTHNFNCYKEIIAVYPVVEKIIKGIYADPRYAIRSIWHSQFKTRKTIVFYFNQSCGIESHIMPLLIKHDVAIQFPGNQKYNFSVSIDL